MMGVTKEEGVMMDNYFTRIDENLGKLKRNEEQMSLQQKKQYEKPLRKLKQQIADDATLIMKDFIISGCRILRDHPEERDEFIKRMDAILEEDGQTRTKEAGKVLFSTYNVDKFLEALLPLHWRIWYEAYGPVWLSHCKATGDEEYPYHNDIIDMDWSDEYSLWKDRNDGGVTIMLPPTRELLDKQYQRDRESIS